MSERIQNIMSEAGPDPYPFSEQAEVYSAAARERLVAGRNQIHQFIINDPARALGIALGMGVLLGWLIKRR
jgi:hypothetical protein